ncbi:beta-1,2-xylosyltransferase [Salix suchowensis]|nr:beta-1,2-xylosyltransferase [Salix suchowensis]
MPAKRCFSIRNPGYRAGLQGSFRKQDRKRLGYGALAASLLITFSFFTVFNPYLGSLPLCKSSTVLALQLSELLSTWDDQKLFVVNDSSSCLQMVKEIIPINDGSSSQEAVARDAEMVRNNKKLINDDGSSRKTVNGIIIEDSLIVNDTSNSQEIATAADADAAAMDEKTKLRCNIMGRSEFCEMKGDIRIDGNSSTAFIVSSETDILTAENTSWSIRPYARKEALGEKDFARKCVPAILFSAGGYSGNFFHAFTDIIIPLYSTARTFNREVQFLMTDRKPWWIAKFKTLFEALSRYEIIDIDDRHDVHCFHSLTIGLKGRNNKELSIDSSTSPYSMKDFRKFLRSWYSLKKITAAIIRDGDKRNPRLLIIPRKRSRSFTNVGEIAQLAESLSYQVIVAEPGPDVSGFAKIINSCDVLMGSSWCWPNQHCFPSRKCNLDSSSSFWNVRVGVKSFLRRSCEGHEHKVLGL